MLHELWRNVRRASVATATAFLATLLLTGTAEASFVSECVESFSGNQHCLLEVDSTTLGAKIPLVLIHGWNQSRIPGAPQTESWDNFVAYFNRSSLRTRYKLYYFSYFSNDVAVVTLGQYLRDVLDLASATDAAFAEKQIAILAHSMGGLVARSYMQEHRHGVEPYSGATGGSRVLSLITLGTPHHGSPLANDNARDALAGLDWAVALNAFEALFFFSNFGQRVHSNQVNRSDVRWDNYDALFDYMHFPADRNVWLEQLNSDISFDNKIIAYGGAIAAADRCGVNVFCWGSTIMGGLFELANDGVVPLASAFFLGPTGRSRVATRYFPDYDHTQIRAGQGHDGLFDSISLDLESVLNIARPTLTLTNLSDQSRNPYFIVGDQWRLDVTGATPNKVVFLSFNRGSGIDRYGLTDNLGRWSLEGAFSSAAIGTWEEIAIIGDRGPAVPVERGGVQQRGLFVVHHAAVLPDAERCNDSIHAYRHQSGIGQSSMTASSRRSRLPRKRSALVWTD